MEINMGYRNVLDTLKVRFGICIIASEITFALQDCFAVENPAFQAIFSKAPSGEKWAVVVYDNFGTSVYRVNFTV